MVTHIVEEEIEAEKDILVHDLVDILLCKYGEAFEAVLVDKASRRLKLPVCINGRYIRDDIRLQDGDRVGFMFVVAGG